MKSAGFLPKKAARCCVCGARGTQSASTAPRHQQIVRVQMSGSARVWARLGVTEGPLHVSEKGS